MEDDDEFGDLYTDVLRPFSSSLSSAPLPKQPSPALPLTHRPIDLNLHDQKIDVHDDEILCGVSGVNIPAPSDRTLPNSFQNSIPPDNNTAAGPRVLGSKLPDNTSDVIDFTSDKQDKEVTFDIEEGNTGPLANSGPMIPGIAVDAEYSKRNEADVGGGREVDEDSEEDSDSEDDLQIVLNDANHGPMGMERGIMGDADDDDDDEDGDPLVIVADGDPNQPIEEQEWGVGEDAATATGAEGERKEGCDVAGKGITVAGAKIGYNNHGYHHSFHSQFKYVRPGAVPMPGATTVVPGGAPGQVRPPINMAPLAGRGRGDWRPAGIKNVTQMQKGYHPGFGWGNNVAGRGFGGGLEFTLPSHKTIFEVDIDSFEEKPWKYPGVDISDFFNFGLNEESWKDYCKQLEQYRLETTMQSKIRVYESGRAEQEYDPDLPPELAVAAGIHIPADNSNLGKSDVGQSDLTKGPPRMRPPLPTGRAIQVEGGYGERLPSIDVRPPRIRDSDAIIEIVLQDSPDDDSSTGNDGLDGASNDPQREDVGGSPVPEEDIANIETEYYDDFPQGYKNQKSGRGAPYNDHVHSNTPDQDGILPFHPEVPSQYHAGSRGQPMSSGGDFVPSHKERQGRGRTSDVSPHGTPSGAGDKRSLDNVEEDSVESMDGKRSPVVSSPTAVRDARELSVEDKDVTIPNEPVLAEGSFGMKKDEVTENEVAVDDTLKKGNAHLSIKNKNLSSCVEQSALQELDDGEDPRAARNSENSKARSGSSKDYQKWQDGVEEEVVQDGHAMLRGSIKTPLDENDHYFRRKECDARPEMERNHMAMKGREGSYPCRDLDASLDHHLHVRNEGYDRRRERENPDGALQWRGNEDLHSRKSRTEDMRKRERGDEMGSRHRSKIREGERSDREQYLHSRKQFDSGSYRVHYDKDGGSRHREREDNLKSRYDMVDDYHSKRMKDDEYLRRDHTNEEILHVHRESTSRRRRERDDVLDPRKRNDQRRIRDNLDDYNSGRHKDDVWPVRERGERQRGREELYKLKQSHEENLSKREKEGRGSLRTGRGADDKAWIGQPWVKDEYRGSDRDYQLKDAVRNSELQKRKDRVEEESYSHHRGRDDLYVRGNQPSNEERKSRQERSSTRIDRAVDTADSQRVHEKRHKDNMRKNKESEGGEHNTLGTSRRNQDDQSGHIDEMGLGDAAEKGKNETAQHNSSKRRKEDASSDDEQQDSRRGRSKMERWTSHKERDYSINNKQSSSLTFKETDMNNNSGSSEANKLADEISKRNQPVEKHSLSEEKDAADVENKDSDTKSLQDRHLDTVEKLKKRSERFKLPMPSEKDALTIKKMESEALPSVKNETPIDSEIKSGRPPRKRRWISN